MMSARRLLPVIALLALSPVAARASLVSGVVFDDRNGDGEQRTGESGVSGWVVYIDGDGDGRLDNPDGDGTCTANAAEACAVTDSGGAFSFPGLPEGSIDLRTVPQPHWSRTTDEVVEVLLPTDETEVDDVRFGVFRFGTAAGVVFEDANGNGQRDENERGLPGFIAFADDDLDGAFDAGEPSAVSAADGSFAIDGLTLGAHAVLVRTHCDFVQTLPAPPSRYVVSITTGGQVVEGRNFGLRPPQYLPGDGNGDGVVTAADTSAVLRVIYGLDAAYGSDANHDLSVNLLDVFITSSNIFECADLALPVAPPLPTSTATRTATPTEPPGTPTATLPGPSATATTPPSATATATAPPSASATHTAPPSSTATGTPVATTPPTATATFSPPISTLTATQTRTVTQTQTATPVAGPDPAALAGTAAQIANGMNAIPAVITALVSGIQFGALEWDPDAAQTSGVGGPAGACPGGGTATRSCSNGTLAIDLASCKVPTASGSATLEELPPATSAVRLVGSSCLGGLPFPPPYNTTIGVSAVFRDPGSALLLTATAALTGSINPALGGSCQATGATMTISGTIRTQFADGSVTSIAFTNTGVVVAVQQFNAQCVPLRYTMTFNGPGTVTVAPPPALTFGGPAESSTAVTFSNFVVAQNATASPTLTELDGGLGPACGGPSLTLDTTEPLAQVVGQQCPQDGTLKVLAGGSTTQLFYLSGGAVDLDANNDGVAESRLDSCREAPPLCEAGNTPTPTRTASVTATRTETPVVPATATATFSATPTFTMTRTPTVTQTVPPGSTVTSTPTRTATATVTRTFTVTATPSLAPTATPTATPPPAPEMICDSLPGPALIPDANATGINNTIVVPSGPSIADLNVSLVIAHTWPGDLRVTLTHVDTGTSVTLLDLPGAPALTNGCGSDDGGVRDDVDAVFDDASLRPAEDRCAAGPPLSAAIDGSVRPAQLLSAFNGQSLAGSWRLNVADLATQDAGSLISWCLRPNSLDPVVRNFTCGDGQTECVLVVNDPFDLAFSYNDPNGDAATWQIMARRDDGFEFEAGSGTLQFGSGGTVNIPFEPFTCPTNDCPDTDFDYFVTVTDQAGHESVAQRLRLIVSLIGG